MTPKGELVGGRYNCCSRFATSQDASGHVQTFFVDGDGHNIALIERECISSQTVPRLFNPYRTCRIEKNVCCNY